jgi:phospho-N-acetylmuramoyl-pentapeptide-transferase
MIIVNLAMAGALLGYLRYNWYPAKVFMGDTGSLALGGYVVAVAFALKMPFILLIVGIVYVIETLSVIIQVLVFKKTRKRIFKMAPIHHHFELSGWHEKKIVFVFTGLTALGAFVAYLSII